MRNFSVKALLIAIGTFFLLTPCQAQAFLGTAKARLLVKVMNEQGQFVEDADFKIRFSPREDPVIGKTDSMGMADITGNSSDGVIIGVITKKGFYESSFHSDFFIKKFGRWQPWKKEITVVLRPIVNPVPMYVRNRWFEIPQVGKEIGFDLMKADWVIPYGQGIRSDFIFKVEPNYKNATNFASSIILTFSNTDDGIQAVREDSGGDFTVGSYYRLPRTAPKTGYQPKLEKRMSTSSPDFYALKNNDMNYIIRVRSEVDENGEFKNAIHGKIRGEIEFDPRNTDTTKIRLFYYLNPDGTRNLEFDPERNLFPKGRGEAQP